MRNWILTLAITLAFSTLLIAQESAFAQIKPGDFINQDNAHKIANLVSPGVLARVRNGMSMKIVPTERIDWPPPYRDATEKYSAQVTLSDDHRSLIGYVAGQPFPLIDPNDPDAGTKIMWNVAFRPISSDDYDLRFFDCESVYWGLNQKRRVITYIQVGHYAGYNLVGRTEVEPLPVDPDFKLTHRYFLSGLYPVIAPEDARGVGLIRYRYADPKRADDSWTYLGPQSRRVRRLDEPVLDTASGAQAYDPNDYEGFSGKNENYEWRYLGEKNLLACINTDKVPDRICPTDGGASHCPDPWEMRHLFVIEARPGKRFTNTLYSRDIMYIDSEADFVMYHDMYDRAGQLFKNYTSWMTYRDRPVPDAKVAIYPFKREFQVGSSSVNVQTGFSTVCYHPGYDVPEKEDWYINMGAVDKDFCTVQAMVRAAP